MATAKLNLNKNPGQEASKEPEKRPEPKPEPVIEPAEKTTDLSQPEVSIPSQPTKQVEEKQETKEPAAEPEKTKNHKAHKRQKTSTKKSKKPKKDAKDLTVEEQYVEYKKRKFLVFVLIIAALIGVLFFGFFNTFLKHELTPEEAAIYTNSYNTQMQNQKWDSGIQSYLQANLKVLLKNKFVSTASTRDYTVDNISIERNQPVSDTMFLTFFEADLTAQGITDRLFCYIFISTADNKMQAASDVSITSRQSFSASADVLPKNDYIAFDDSTESTEDSKSFQNVLDNFLTLGYNLHQDTSNIYKGQFPLAMQGTYLGINTCHVYKEANELGFDAKAEYTIEESNGFRYTNTCYMQIEKQHNNTWIIKQIM